MSVATPRLVRGSPPTAWARPLVDEALAASLGIDPLHVVLVDADGWLEDRQSVGPQPPGRDPHWRAVARDLARALDRPEDVRDEGGTLLAVQAAGEVAVAALIDPSARKSLLRRLGARTAWVAVRSHDALRAIDRDGPSPRASAAELRAWAGDDSLLDGVLEIDGTGVVAVVHGCERTDRRGTTPLPADDAGPTRDLDAIRLTRTVLAFLAGLTVALVLAFGLAS